MPSISVLMPCRNAMPYLPSTMDSVLRQLGPDDELVVQDAMSDDGSAAVLDRAAAGDSRVRVCHEPDAGQSDALNRALERACGDLVCWLNADDLLLPGALDAVRAATGDALPEVVVGGWELHDAAGTVLRRKPASALRREALLLHGCYAFSGAVLVRRDVLHEVGGYAENLHYAMDFDLMLRLACREQLTVHTGLAALRYHQDSKSGSAASRFFTEALAVRSRAWRGPKEAALTVAGTALHGAGVLTSRLRYTAAYTRARAALLERGATRNSDDRVGVR